MYFWQIVLDVYYIFVINQINQLQADQNRFIILAAELCWLVIDEVEVNLAPV